MAAGNVNNSAENWLKRMDELREHSHIVNNELLLTQLRCIAKKQREIVELEAKLEPTQEDMRALENHKQQLMTWRRLETRLRRQILVIRERRALHPPPATALQEKEMLQKWQEEDQQMDMSLLLQDSGIRLAVPHQHVQNELFRPWLQCFCFTSISTHISDNVRKICQILYL